MDSLGYWPLAAVACHDLMSHDAIIDRECVLKDLRDITNS